MLANLFSKNEKKGPEWISLDDLSMLDKIKQDSMARPVLIFKHSTRCSISSMTLNRFERSATEEVPFDLYFLDLIAHREVSNEVANTFQVEHQSPQAILISNGNAIYDASHTGILFEDVVEKVAALT